jgi:purine-nucleoside phosphorylase
MAEDYEISLYDQVEGCVEWLKKRISGVPDVAMILGSGLGALCDEFEDAVALDYSEIPGFPESAVEGHAGKLVCGRLAGKTVVAMQGRVHYYEGWSMQEVTFPVRAFALWGIERLLVTNSAGGANPDYQPGDLMVIADQINLTGVNPLRGANDERFGPRFPDMSYAYDPQFRETILSAGKSLGIELRQGVYAGFSGPSYETPAEIRMIQTLGGDAVGMSTVPEVIVANHGAMKVGGISCITNLAAGLGSERLNHDEVKETADRVREQFSSLVRKTVELL